MIDIMDRPNGCFYSDSDDDRRSSSQSTTSTTSMCEYTRETQLPSSLRKLMNPMLPSGSSQHSLPTMSQATEPGTAKPPRICLAKEDNSVGHDLTRLRPWKRLPPPRPLGIQPRVSLPPIYVCLPSPRTSPGTLGSCSPSSPQFSPYYFPVPHSSRERAGRVNPHSEHEDSCKMYDPRDRSCVMSPPSSSNSGPLSVGEINDFQSNIKKKLNISSPDAMTPRSEQNKISKKINKTHEKERNRCLTCGSAFSTFANLTRHEKKCPLANSRLI